MNLFSRFNLYIQQFLVVLIPSALLVYFAVLDKSAIAGAGAIIGICTCLIYAFYVKKRLAYIKQISAQISDDRIHDEILIYGSDELADVMNEIKESQKKLLAWGDWQIGQLVVIITNNALNY